MKTERICKKCEIVMTCPIRNYTTFDRELRLKIPEACVYYTCPVGKQAARRALLLAQQTNTFTEIVMDNSKIAKGARFGTLDKPTKEDDGEFQRLVDEYGFIIIRDPDCNYMYSGQNMNNRTLTSQDEILRLI